MKTFVKKKETKNIIKDDELSQPLKYLPLNIYKPTPIALLQKQKLYSYVENQPIFNHNKEYNQKSLANNNLTNCDNNFNKKSNLNSSKFF